MLTIKAIVIIIIIISKIAYSHYRFYSFIDIFVKIEIIHAIEYYTIYKENQLLQNYGYNNHYTVQYNFITLMIIGGSFA